MEQRQLGRTGLMVSKLSFGASSLGGVFREIDEAEAIRTVQVALDLGLNLIDVSPYYGLTRAETVLGKALAGVPRERYLLATKVGRYGADQFDFSAARVTRSVDESLARLGLDHIDLIQCHDIEFVPLAQVVDEALPALRRLQAQGKVRFVGITGLPLAIYPAIMEQAPVDTILSYCHCSLNDTTLLDLLPYLQRHEVGVISASPLSMGLLGNRGAPAWHPAPAEVIAACARAADYCRERGASLPKLAVQYAVAQPGIHTTVVGSASPQHMRDNVAWLDEPLDQELLDGVLAILAPIRNVTWPSGLPENQ
ncbi:MAG: aldo/keto reductase [Armatimonadetes bacterium]|nr:aldo/keto reductase [Armatimonadota bacterium]